MDKHLLEKGHYRNVKLSVTDPLYKQTILKLWLLVEIENIKICLCNIMQCSISIHIHTILKNIYVEHFIRLLFSFALLYYLKLQASST